MIKLAEIVKEIVLLGSATHITVIVKQITFAKCHVKYLKIVFKAITYALEFLAMKRITDVAKEIISAKSNVINKAVNTSVKMI